ncbi:hypothetical protein PACTADRAFT_793 [Pachysolen tannophilus NRRL Y-2460]|uniref:JAB1/MPN/MOV34 metalloenzyme domain-containing protein n=1 Tax=Pachysolen tannophilus NRRL Y-2460 TaxID=669874 RepID=A0A1E4U2U5_PACTA|nr:hypothetical protein PACTADRAFT_793 [Pachysolen tannophilus NRRL Y-2460]
MSSDSDILLHPLTVISICDYFTRVTLALKENDKQGKLCLPPLLIGGLLGVRTNNGLVSVINSFEIPLSDEKLIDERFLKERLAQFKIIYPNHDFLGIYQIDNNNKKNDNGNGNELINIISNSILINEILQKKGSLVYLLIDPLALNKDDYPISFHNITPIDVINKRLLTNELSYEFKTLPSEKVTLDTINSFSISNNNKNFEPVESIQNKKNSIKNGLNQLDNKLNIIINYLEKIEGNDDEILKEINKFSYYLKYIGTNTKLKSQLDEEKLNLLITATSNLMLFLDSD